MARGLFSSRRAPARRAALSSARRPACPSCTPRRATVPFLPVVRPVARDGALPVVRPQACGGYVACRGAPGARATPPPFPVACRGDVGGARVAPSVARHGALGGRALAPPVFVAALPCPAILPRPCPGPALLLPLLRPCPVLVFGGGECGGEGYPNEPAAPVAHGSIAPAARLSRGASYSCSPKVRFRGGNGGGGTGSGGTGARRVGSVGGQRQQQQRRSETPSPLQLREWLLRGVSGGSCPYVIRMGDRAGQTCGRLHTQHRCFSRLEDAWHAEFGDDVKLPRRADLLKSMIAIFDLDFDAILSAMYALSVSAEGDCYRCVSPDPYIAAAALGASESGTLPSPSPDEDLHTFTLDSSASRCFFRDSTTLTPLPAPVPVRLADPSRGPVVACSSTVLPCLAVAASCSCRLLSHQTLLWHHRLGHPSLPHLRGIHSCLLLSGLPRSLPPLPPSPATPCLPCVEGQQCVAPHSSSFPPMTAPLLTLHMDVWGPARVSAQSRERYFLLAVDDYTRYTTVFPLRSKGQDLPVLCLHSDRGGEFSSDLLRDFVEGRAFSS
ncbi:unnamed protein product, partial [Closterium sp. NIES-54]